jgi:PilZ domain
LKQQDLVVGPLLDPAAATKKPVQGDERRKDARFSISASAEVLELSTRTRLTGRASDLGPGGCYIDTVSPFPIGASLMLTLTCENQNVHVKANVVYSRTGMGMGLAFTEMTAKQKENLTAWLRELNGEAPQSPASEPNMPYVQEAIIEEPKAQAEDTGLLGALAELISLLRVKRILSDSEVEVLREKLSK